MITALICCFGMGMVLCDSCIEIVGEAGYCMITV